MDYEEVMAIVRHELAVHPTPMKTLAIRVGVSPSALSAIASGRTKWPRHTTLFSLLDVLGLQLTIKRREYIMRLVK